MPPTPSRLAGLLLGATACALAPSAALAQSGAEPAPSPEPEPPEAAAAPGHSGHAPVSWEVAAGTRFPLEIGIDGVIEVPLGFTAHLGLGFMPRFYRDAINSTATGFGWYSDSDAEVVAAALEDAFLISPTVGWRPPPVPSLELYIGYVVAFAGGTVTEAEAEMISNQDLPDRAEVAEVPLSGTVHGFQVGLAYQIALERHLALRLSLAYFQVVGSSTSIDVSLDGAAAQRVVDRVEVAVDDYVHHLLTTYVKSPLLGISAVWRF
ncbi:MAG TPA: hypothetical protein VKB80_35925 [Kofleriaceae bacterium]|nr:hypothetical protein [Kofleriaceae bacterium]